MRPGLGATYRLQLRRGFGFAHAAALAAYLVDLGIETLYCSPVTEAVPGSTHGYDGTDPTRIRAELGGSDGYDALVGACETHGLGICLDIVPNHLATWPGGGWWRSLLLEGPDGELGEVFDVDWDASPPGAPRTVTLPVLDRPLEAALAAGLVALREGPAGPVLSACGVELPVAGGSVRPGEGLAEVLGAQHYRLVDWHDPAERNYRRFFDVDGLAGVRVERPEVFARTHALVVELARSGRCSALRVDHVDGLADPAAYLHRLREATGLPVVVEKILTGDEALRRGWPVAGTTGYEVLDDIGGALVDAEGLERLVAAGRAEGDQPVGACEVGARRLVVETLFPGELARSAARLAVAPRTLAEVSAHLPVYRTYLDAGEAAPEDRAAIGEACARAGAAEVEAALLDPARRDAAVGYQQLSGAVMAKGVEDTAWYRLAGPLAFCDVGGDPGRPRHDGPARLHTRAAARARDGRAGLVPSTTHDTKRSGDVRARLYALSELAGGFEEGLARLRSALGATGAPCAPGAPGSSETRLLAQLLLGTLPAPGTAVPIGAAGGSLASRVGDALVKGAREAKLRTSWVEPDDGYERHLRELVDAACADGGRLLAASFGDLVGEVARLGATLSLSAVVLRSALPGVPDCYQGDETWNCSLVDPDNRRPVDHGRLRAMLAALEPRPGAGGPGARAGLAAELRRSWPDGRVKLLVTATLLRARRQLPGAFAPGARHVPLEAEGPAAPSVLAFGRLAGHAGGVGGAALAVVTRLASRLGRLGGDLPSGAAYAGTALAVPAELAGPLVDVVTGRQLRARAGRLEVADVLADLPVALLRPVR
ncbi:MAG TPA: malto-oligosyltrehalose synthase [Acidimicrobiales bacterium]|nr:malto-oligosyltrehalose synthase [Acidimicrobiales bacterium]